MLGQLLADVDCEEGVKDNKGHQWLLESQGLDLRHYLRRLYVEIFVLQSLKRVLDIGSKFLQLLAPEVHLVHIESHCLFLLLLLFLLFLLAAL